MNKKILLLLSLVCTLCVADPTIIARYQGNLVYSSCIVIPPKTKPQIAYCKQIYTTYKTYLLAVSSPTPLGVNTTPSPYYWSEFDVCRYDASAFVFDSPLNKPYCPSI